MKPAVGAARRAAGPPVGTGAGVMTLRNTTVLLHCLSLVLQLRSRGLGSQMGRPATGSVSCLFTLNPNYK